jgi:hypothetical protein
MAVSLRVTEPRQGSGVYSPVPAVEFVDGVFVPDKGEVKVNSDGDIYSDFPDTSNELYESIYNGHHTRLPDMPDRHKLFLDKKACGTKENPAIALHCNLGITFDLRVIRQSLPGIKLVAFRAKCGISDNAYENAPENTEELWVLVDGDLKYASGKMLANTPSKEIYIELNEDNHFLTLVSTDGDMNVQNDWGIFAEPVLELDDE